MNQPVWNTEQGSLGNYPSGIPIIGLTVLATPVLPAVFVTYKIISGSLPSGLTLETISLDGNNVGLISGTPDFTTVTITNTFVVRATDNYGNIRDRTFSLTLSGNAVPSFTTPPGLLATINDSTFTEIQIDYNNPVSSNIVSIRRTQGTLPPGLEINEFGLIRGYADPPFINTNRDLVVTNVIATNADTDTLTCLSTTEFFPGRPIIFTGIVFGSIIAELTYYVRTVINGTSFTVSYVPNGSTVPLTSDAGYMIASLPGITVGEPTNRNYSFTLRLDSLLGSVSQNYSITVVNQNTPVSQNGPGNPPNTRKPAIFNTQPDTYKIEENISDYGYYILPPDSRGNTYLPDQPAFIGTFENDNIFEFKILGHDFDDNILVYNFQNLPLGFHGDSITGWVTGNPLISPETISDYGFSVNVSKKSNPTIVSDTINFSLRIRNDIKGDITWLTPEDMGTVFNGITSIKYVEATCDVPLSYQLVEGTLPPNLTLLSNGELSGIVSFQPSDTVKYTNMITDFTFTIQAYSPNHPAVRSNRTFTLSVYQEFGVPFDTVYCKCTPDIKDRNLLRTLLDNSALIPDDFLYRPQDPFFGKAKSVIYDHIYGIYANDIDAYIEAIEKKNHYYRSITLGEIKTAIARDEFTGEILYEVVYSEIIDNLINYNQAGQYSNIRQSNIVTPQGRSVSKELNWPRPIPLSLGPWYDTNTDIYASYISNNQVAEYNVTSTTSVTNTINCFSTSGISVGDMVIFIGNVFGNIEENKIYFVANVVSSTQFQISLTNGGPVVILTDMSGSMIYNAFTPPVDYYASLTPGFARVLYPNSLPNMRQQVIDVLGQDYKYQLLPLWMTSQQRNGSTLGYTPAWVIAYCKPETTTLDGNTVSYAEYIKYQIQNNWKSEEGIVQTLNSINFEIDRFAVNKSKTYNYDNTLSPATFTQLPGATPTPDPIDSKDFYVLFPRRTILPDETQYNQ